jgi:phosphate starvation-inducible PhoH-like protein
MSKKNRRNDNGDNYTDNSLENNNKLNKQFKPLTKGQTEYIRAITESQITLCTGPAGSGKTACAVGLACEHLLHDKVKQIVITRPVVETGRQGLGYLPGSMVDKIHPYLVPVLDEMTIYLGKFKTDLYIQSEKIRIVPLEYMRGYNFHRSFVILDEAQNATLSQIKMFLTRIGQHSTVVISGDIEQSDLYDDQMGLKICLEKLQNTRDVSIVTLSDVDIVRNNIISRILEKLR